MKKHLNKDICFVCCYYNPFNYTTRFLNFISFLDSALKNNVDILVVEAYNSRSTFRVNKLCKSTISIETDQIYWMKEMLLNIGIHYLLKEGIRNIGWLDADITFNDNQFSNRVLDSLERYNMVQVFSSCKKNIMDASETTSSLCMLASQNSNHLDLIINRVGDIGYGYAYKSDIFKKIMLYDKAIMGTGDWLNLLGGIPLQNSKELYNDRFFKGTTVDFFNSYTTWQSKMSNILQNSIGYADNKITILSHGYLHKRKYIERESIIKKEKFNPNIDLIYYKTIPELKSENLKKVIETYMKSRKEDETLTQNCIKKINSILII